MELQRINWMATFLNSKYDLKAIPYKNSVALISNLNSNHMTFNINMWKPQCQKVHQSCHNELLCGRSIKLFCGFTPRLGSRPDVWNNADSAQVCSECFVKFLFVVQNLVKEAEVLAVSEAKVVEWMNIIFVMCYWTNCGLNVLRDFGVMLGISKAILCSFCLTFFKERMGPYFL